MNSLHAGNFSRYLLCPEFFKIISLGISIKVKFNEPLCCLEVEIKVSEDLSAFLKVFYFVNPQPITDFLAV